MINILGGSLLKREPFLKFKLDTGSLLSYNINWYILKQLSTIALNYILKIFRRKLT